MEDRLALPRTGIELESELTICLFRSHLSNQFKKTVQDLASFELGDVFGVLPRYHQDVDLGLRIYV